MRVFNALLGPNQQALASSTLEHQAQTQREQLRRNFIAAVVNSDRTELPRNELLFHKRGIIEYVATADGDWYTAAGSTGNDPAYLPDAKHYYVTASGDVVLLQPAPGRVTSRRKLEEHRAAREQRRQDQQDAAKARYQQLRKTAR